MDKYILSDNTIVKNPDGDWATYRIGNNVYIVGPRGYIISGGKITRFLSRYKVEVQSQFMDILPNERRVMVDIGKPKIWDVRILRKV